MSINIYIYCGATKHPPAAQSFYPKQDEGENWKGKRNKTCG